MIAALRATLRTALLALPELQAARATVIGWENRPVTPPAATPGAAPWLLELLRVGPALTRAFRPGHRLVAVDAETRVTLDVRVDTAEPGPVVLAPEAPGWAARPVRLGLTTRRRVDASGAAVPFA